MHVYYKEMTSPIASLFFSNPIDSITGQVGAEPDPGQFVSSVSWMKKREDVLVAANSMGRIKILELC